MKTPYLRKFHKILFNSAGIMPQFLPMASKGARFETIEDLSPLFPYINSVLTDTKYHTRPELIQFILHGIHCSVYAHEILAAPFSEEHEAHAFGQRLIAFINDLATKRNDLKPDFTKTHKLAVTDLYRLLPRTNCRSCGYESCLAFACALSKERTEPDCCPSFRPPIAVSALYPVYDNQGNPVSTISIRTSPKNNLYKKAPLSSALKNKPGNDLTGRELEVLRLLAGGSTNGEISRKLHISPHTVKTHVSHIFDKIGVNDRTRAAVWATRNELV